MVQKRIRIGRVPVLRWGEDSSHVVLAVHGYHSSKSDTPIQLLAEVAVSKGYQVVSFDLPAHGEREIETTPCTVFNSTEDLRKVIEWVLPRWKTVTLFANSIGAYFSLMTYSEEPLRNCLFLSPVVDMGRIIEQMMEHAQVTPEALEEAGQLPTPEGETLYWSYYQYAKNNPVRVWPFPTAILRGGKDTLCEAHTVEDFAAQFGCRLEVMEQGEHGFRTPEELSAYGTWLERELPEAAEQ